jgi:hypothetical protein
MVPKDVFTTTLPKVSAETDAESRVSKQYEAYQAKKYYVLHKDGNSVSND